MDKFFINVPTTQGAADYKTTYVTGTQSVPRDDSRDNQIAFLKATQEIVTRGTVFGGNKTSVDSSKFTIDTAAQYNLAMDENGVISMVKYKTATANNTSSSCGKTESGAGNYTYGMSYILSAQATTNNEVSYSITTNGNKCTLVSIQYGDDYLYGGSSYITNGVVHYDDSSLADPIYTDTSSITGSLTLTSSDPGYAADAAEKRVDGDMGTTAQNSGTSSISARTFDVKWHEKGTSTLKSATHTINGSSSSQKAQPQCFIYYTTGVFSKAADDTLASTSAISSDTIKSDNIASYSGKSATHTFTSSAGNPVNPVLAFPASWGLPSVTWNGNPENDWEELTGLNIKLNASANLSIDYKLYKHRTPIESNFTFVFTW